MGELPPVNFRFCSTDYFRTMGIDLVSGRAFGEPDRPRRVAVISEATARLVWPNENPVGQTFGRGTGDDPGTEVVGVVRDVRVSLDRPPVATLYVPLWATNERPNLNLVVRYSAGAGSLAAPLRQAVWGLDRDVVVGEVRTMEDVMSASVAGRRFQLALTAAFAAAALLLACLGIYGVVSWSVTRRRGEIGVRMALGAGSRAVRRMLVAEGMRPVAAGLGLGVASAMGLGRFVGSLLFGVSPRDPWTLATVTAVLAAVAALACYVPGRRATLAEPLKALRDE
jgi:predicted permease